MARRKQKTPEPEPLRIRYDENASGWMVEGALKKLRPFTTKMDAENYCIQKLRRCPVTVSPQATSYQDLPRTSVWTGAPGDKAFKDVVR